jgi:hypothetical protein
MSSGSIWTSMTNIYEYMKNYLVYQKTNQDIEIDTSHNPVIYETIIVTPLDIVLREMDMCSRQEIFEFLIQNREYKTIRFIITKYYSIYLLCHFIFDILDILSNELFHLQTKIIFCFDPQHKLVFIEEFKGYIKSNIPSIQKNKILPIYIKFLENPSYHLEYNVHFDQRFHILFLKESEDDFSIQRLHFSIDL